MKVLYSFTILHLLLLLFACNYRKRNSGSGGYAGTASGDE